MFSETWILFGLELPEWAGLVTRDALVFTSIVLGLQACISTAAYFPPFKIRMAEIKFKSSRLHSKYLSDVTILSVPECPLLWLEGDNDKDNRVSLGIYRRNSGTLRLNLFLLTLSGMDSIHP